MKVNAGNKTKPKPCSIQNKGGKKMQVRFEEIK